MLHCFRHANAWCLKFQTKQRRQKILESRLSHDRRLPLASGIDRPAKSHFFWWPAEIGQSAPRKAGRGFGGAGAARQGIGMYLPFSDSATSGPTAGSVVA